MDTTKRKGIDRLCPKGLLILLFMLPAGLWAQDAGVAATTAAPDATAGALGELATGLNTVWMLLAAMLVFFMQPGFALVEAGFIRTKNTANVLMKNLVDFMFGSILFWFIGFGLMFGIGGFVGAPHFFNLEAMDKIIDNGLPIEGFLIFQTVFCATAATIVSGAMAERTKFLSYCIYSLMISLVVYPVSGHWIWGGGFISQMGFHDFAGSCAVHMVGGVAAFIGAVILGPRIGKYSKSGKSKAIPGHNLTVGALGVFILWLGWYGFNGAACTSVEQLGSVFLTTTVAPAVATVVCMIFTWIKYGKPDVSMCLNASLAGLVAITAPCDVTDCFGAIVIGAVAGLLVVFGVWLLDYKLHVDDPVGAVAVHCLNGIWGTIATGLFATTSAPGNDSIVGLFYGGGFKQLGLQLLGFVSVAAWTAVTITIAFLIIKATVGLRVSEEEEIVGLDSCEHGLPSAYAGFSIMDISNTMTMEVNENTSLGVSDYDAASAAMKEAAVKVETAPAAIPATGIYKVVVIAKLARFEVLKKALNDLGVTGMTMTQVMGCGVQKGAGEMYRGVEMDATLLPKVKVEVVVSKIPVATVIEAAKKALYTGHIGDGKIFVYNVDKVVKVRTGEEDFAALQDVE